MDATASDGDTPTSATDVTPLSRFSQFFAQYHLPLLDYLYGMTRDRELAADLAQDTFMKAFADAPELAGILHPKAWLYTIATHLALNAARHRGRFEWLPLSRVEPEAAGGTAEEAWASLPAVVLPPVGQDDFVASVAEREVVWAVLAELRPSWRAVLLLQASAGFEVREIAAHLQLSEGNVRKILFRAKERFRARYTDLAMRGA
jgi:RNA polymerase sigma-70 factor (ECF subfamily)